MNSPSEAIDRALETLVERAGATGFTVSIAVGSDLLALVEKPGIGVPDHTFDEPCPWGKGSLSVWGPAIDLGLARAALELWLAARAAPLQELLKVLWETSRDALVVTEGDIIIADNAAIRAEFDGSLLGKRLTDVFPGAPPPTAENGTSASGVLSSGRPVEMQTYSYRFGPVFFQGLRLWEAGLGRDSYGAFFEDSSAIALLIDPTDGRIVDANAAAVVFYGWSRDELRKMNITDINQLDADVVRTKLDAANQRLKGKFLFQHRRARGDKRDVEVYSGPIHFGGKTMLLSILHDVTDWALLEAQLRHALKLDAIGRLAGGIAHDFNNLLSVMLGYADDLRSSLPSGSVARRDAEQVLQAARRAETLTRQLMSLGRQQGTIPSRICLTKVVVGLEELLRRAIGERIALIIDARVPAWIENDVGLIEQIVLNLAVNARDAMPDGGELRIDVEILEGADSLHGRFGRLAIADTGVGMDADTLGRVFQPFFTTKAQGTGLGLATVADIVRKSGGRITVRSELGQGTTFEILFPLVAAPAESPPIVVPPKIGPLPVGRTVLVVEDDPDLREFLRYRLRTEGYVVIDAFDGEEALRMAQSMGQPLDLVVTDMMMPGMTGVQLVERLRANRQGLRVLYVSGYEGEAGVRPFLAKPFTGDAFAQAVRDALTEPETV